MAKLKTLRPVVSTIKPLVARREQAEKTRLAERDTETDWRKWYSTERWKKLRQVVLLRDGYKCQRTGALLTGKHPAPDSPVVDHKRPHRGDPELFWNIDNLQTVSKAYHDSIKQAIEKADQVAAIHPKWLLPSMVPLTIVCGPAASGKSTYVDARKGKDDIVIDLDAIASEISGEPLHAWDRARWLNAALYRRNDLLGSLSRPSKHKAAWFIVSEPKARHRDWWVKTLRPGSVVVLETDERHCLMNAMLDEARDIGRTQTIIDQWWVEYEPRLGDEVVRWA